MCNHKTCKGLFIDAETLEVTRCDACGVFSDDAEAAEHVRDLIKTFSTWSYDFDPSPYCGQCNAKSYKSCDCGPRAAND